MTKQLQQKLNWPTVSKW